MIRNIIFDWSGTLVDDLPGVFKATNYILEQAGVATLTLAEFRAEFELPFTGFYNRFTPDVPLEQLEEWFHSYFGKVCGEVIALPHAGEFLDFCKSERASLLCPQRRQAGVLHRTDCQRRDERLL